eukprot:6201420-Pleurochrysis_carterae.AAC.1
MTRDHAGSCRSRTHATALSTWAEAIQQKSAWLLDAQLMLVGPRCSQRFCHFLLKNFRVKASIFAAQMLLPAFTCRFMPKFCMVAWLTLVDSAAQVLSAGRNAYGQLGRGFESQCTSAVFLKPRVDLIGCECASSSSASCTKVLL